ncbi:ubiquitin-related domain-containing protein [Nemania sp. FL0916]|nr:ubiquitin-related domain-containing protein [Nemania sp. FL0916]
MADITSASAAGDNGSKEERLSMHQPAGDVEMEDLSARQPNPANPETVLSQNDGGDNRPIPVFDTDTKVSSTAEAPSSSQHDNPTSPETEDLTIDPVEPQPSSGALAVNIMLQLTTGVRHPFRIDEKYLTRHNVTVTGKTEDGKLDPTSITVYKLKELILRDWRKEWDEAPSEPSSIRLIHFGKLLEDRNQLSHYNFSTTGKNWVHMTVKPQDLLDEEEAAKKVKESSSHSSRSGCCVIL